MVVYIFMDGNVKIVSPENVYQGSNVTEITLLAPFPDETSVSVGFELPDGTIPEKQPMSYTQTIIDGQSVRAYVYKLPYAVTEQAGNVKISFIAKFTNGQQTSYMANFEVQESVLPQPPENPDQDTYDLLLQYYQDAKNSAIAAQDAAEKAQESALDATDTANTAEEKAEGAVSTANQALETAQAVGSKADSAVSTAEDANKKSDNAVSTASAAAITANDAMSTATSAVSKANDAEIKAESAVSTAEDANQAAENALSEASSAQKVADAASNTASQAQSVAEGIDGKASQALKVSKQASDTAENAQIVAEGIDGKASQALTNSEQAVSTANEAKKLAEQAVAGNGTEVYVDDALQARVDFTSDPQTQIDNIVSGEQVVGKATDADNVKSQINGKNIADIFESDGTTAKKATSATQDADGNVINTTYAKLSQVVRTDAAQSLTDEQKNTVAQNIERSAGRIVNSGEGWYNILTADVNDGYFIADLSVISGYSHIEPTEVKIIAIGGYTVPGLVNTRASITCFSGGALSPHISKVRVRGLEGQICIDIYIPLNTTTHFNDMKVTLNSWKNVDNTMPQVQPFTFVGTEDGTDNVSICDVIPKGISTNGQIYQQGSPVLVGDQSAIFESDGTTVKEASKLATPRALPVNLALSSGNANKFDGSKDTSLGVTGILPVANGGTGQSNLDNVTVGNAKKATNADNVKTNINGKAISDIFESDGTTVKNATKAAADKNGNPLFATDPTKLVASVENGWTETTITGSLPSAGVYLVAATLDVGTLSPCIMVFDGENPAATFTTAQVRYARISYVPKIMGQIQDQKWSATNIANDQTIALTITNVYYKRIA